MTKFQFDNPGKFIPSALVVIGAVIEFFRTPDQFYGYLFFSLAAVLAVGLLSAARLRKHSKKRSDLSWVIMPVLFAAGLFGTMAATNTLGMLFAVLAVYILYFYFSYFPSGIPQYIEQTFVLLGTFMLVVAVWSLNFFFSPPWWLVTLLFFGVSFLIFWQMFYKMGQMEKNLTLGALIGGLIMAEVSWALLFWPVYFFTAALVSFSLFYVCYILSGLYFEGRLTSRKVYFQLALVLLVLFATLASTAWEIML